MALKGKGIEVGDEPDGLIMTATPIPRTLALTYYGDLDVVVLDELPRGRRPVETRVVRTAAARRAAYELVRREVLAGHQAFVVCAAIDEGNRSQVKAAEQEADHLAADVFPDLRVDVLHGRMRPADKERRMQEFSSGESDLLISTTVIEVGVDVPNATVMLVENAERFGLAQLHQLRGRVGRGAARSYCVLMTGGDDSGKVSRERLRIMTESSDGFRIAEKDLEIRGPGAVFGTQQHGLTDLQFLAVALRHPGLLESARDEARLMSQREGGEAAATALLGALRPGWKKRLKLAGVG
jgi:ATP-dependent DNA helicase RecG